MINFIVLISLVGVVFFNYIISTRLNKNTWVLRDSMRFFLGSAFLVVLISWFANITSTENVSNSLGLDKLVSFNAVAIRVRNTVIIVSLLYLAYGTYKEYASNKKNLTLIISLILLTISVLYLVGSLLAGGFFI
ncbi:hypothetical protein DDR33_24540 [Pararcticibacter amylolyticus]|uniref:Uncharacterized protein n=1 Tax=Pararcticibacter amylolyticus TaxID=2173175 RepID=A0A2U2P9F3_9SPHI|nr:hypothetical protein DDR33_24540 [Pararcticibacter amylolyticus]